MMTAQSREEMKQQHVGAQSNVNKELMWSSTKCKSSLSDGSSKYEAS